MRCVIADGNTLSRQTLAAWLRRSEDVAQVIEYGDLNEVPTAVEADLPDAMFVASDTQSLDEFTDRLSALGSQAPLLVVLGDRANTALRAFDWRAADFLLKPLDPNRLSVTLERLHSLLQRRQALTRLSLLNETLENLRARTENGADAVYRDFWLRRQGKTVRVRESEIIWLEAARGYVYFHTPRCSYLHRTLMKDVQARLDDDGFIRIHRSAIVNTRHVSRILSNRHGVYAVELSNEKVVRVGRKYLPALNRFMSRGSGRDLTDNRALDCPAA